MIPALFLSCALALPPAIVTYRGSNAVTARQFVEEYRELKRFLDRVYPGGQFVIFAHNQWHAVPPNHIRLPFTWRGHVIYQRVGRSS